LIPGYFLSAIAPNLPSSSTFVGTDIEPRFFSARLPDNISLHVQSITDPWPTSWLNTFDLVHQRLVLAICQPAAAQRAIEALLELVVPGDGWIQLVEADMNPGAPAAAVDDVEDEQQRQYVGKRDGERLAKFGEAYRESHPRLAEFWNLTQELMSGMQLDCRVGPSLMQMLVAAGATDVKETIVDCGLGPDAPSSVLGTMSVTSEMTIARQFAGMAQGHKWKGRSCTHWLLTSAALCFGSNIPIPQTPCRTSWETLSTSSRRLEGCSDSTSFGADDHKGRMAVVRKLRVVVVCPFERQCCAVLRLCRFRGPTKMTQHPEMIPGTP